ncbi:MAG: FKBP-type peptidyl-prolyl cis-trans isomerase [Candidatus Hodarchaeota archaeon]
MKNNVMLGFLCCFIFLLSITATSGDVYYAAAEGDIVSVDYQQYEADATPKADGMLIVYLGDGPIPPELQEQHPDVITVIHGFWKIITGGTGRAGHNYGEAMKVGDKKVFARIPPEDGYTDSDNEHYGETLYFDVELNVIIYDAVIEHLRSDETESEGGESEITPGYALLVVLASFFLLKRQKQRSKKG